MPSDSLIWAVAQLKPNMISKAEANLERQKFEFFSPKKLVTVRAGKIFKKVQKILFPGYIFVRINPFSKDVTSINSTYGISKLLKVGKKKIGTLPDSFINELRYGRKEKLINSKNALRGDLIKITDGPFVDYIGLVEDSDEKGRLKILFEVLNSTITIKSSFSKVELI